MTDLCAVSLFAGIEGFGLALERAGVQVRASVEIDPACRSIIARHFPKTPLFDDVTKVSGDQLRAAGFVPERGILTGGFPCQDLSVAGRRKGLAGARSGLFWHVMRLADELRPRWLLLENVPGLLSAVCPCPGDGTCVDNGRSVECGEWRAERIPGPADDLPGDDCFICGHSWDFHDAGGFCSPCQDTCEGLPEVRFRKAFIAYVPHNIKGGTCPTGCMAAHGGAMGTVLGALGERGYGFAYRVLDAQHFGVPQRRRRVFIVGCLGDRLGPVEVLLEPEGGERHSSAGGPARPGSASAARGGVVATLQGGGRRGHRLDAEGAAGGHLIAHAITAREGKGPDSDATINPLVASESGPVAFPVALRGRGDASQVECGAGDQPAFALRTPAGGASYPMVATFGGEGVRNALTAEGADASEDGTGRGTPIISLAIAGDFSSSTDRAQTVRSAHGQPGVVAVGFAENQRGEVVESAVSHQLTTGGGKPGQGFLAVRQEALVRRLTPLECERLQGFPDGWTDGQSDAVRYRQLGNSVAVPCVEWIARRIAAVEAALEARGAA